MHEVKRRGAHIYHSLVSRFRVVVIQSSGLEELVEGESFRFQSKTGHADVTYRYASVLVLPPMCGFVNRKPIDDVADQNRNHHHGACGKMKHVFPGMRRDSRNLLQVFPKALSVQLKQFLSESPTQLPGNFLVVFMFGSQHLVTRYLLSGILLVV
ncbi:hypothetical protein CBL_11055 [Carabus blaptoides fortunei]